MYEKGEPCTQTKLCEACSFTLQTINSALKLLEKQGLITLDFAQTAERINSSCVSAVSNSLAWIF